MKNPVRVAVTGAAGNIGYALTFRIAAGDMLGPDQPVVLQLLEITPALGALDGVHMELDDCAFPLLSEIVCTDDADTAFGDADVAIDVTGAADVAGNSQADYSPEAEFSIDTLNPTVTIEQAASQADPANGSSNHVAEEASRAGRRAAARSIFSPKTSLIAR